MTSNWLLGAVVTTVVALQSSEPVDSPTYRKIKSCVDAIPAIDTHDHLLPFERLNAFAETERGKGMNLAAVWQLSYLLRIQSLTPWQSGQRFDDWWAKAKHDFANVRTASFYRYQAIGLSDLYGVDFDRITDDQARDLDQRIHRNYLSADWIHDVVVKRANIELMFNDPYWARFDFRRDYPFGVQVLNVTTLTRGFHPSEFKSPSDSPFAFAARHGLSTATFDDYLQVLDRLFVHAKSQGAVCLKTTLAYERTLDFGRVAKDRAAAIYGKQRKDLAAADVKRFEDFILWRLAGLSAQHGLPFQIHTGDARIQGSNPMQLIDLIEANRQTKFIIFHGGYPWIGETGAIAMKFRNVWIDSCWLPTISHHMAKRAYHEWLDVVPSNRLLWGADCNHAEGIYGATVMTRRTVAEVLAERIERSEITESDAQRVARQILRDNALELFPQLSERIGKPPRQ